MQHRGGADREDLQASSGESLSWRGSLFDWLLAWIPAMHQKPNTAGWAWEKGTGTRQTGVAGASAWRVSGWRSWGTRPTSASSCKGRNRGTLLMVTRPSCGQDPVSLAQGCSRLVAGVPWSEQQGLATEAGPHPASRYHVRPAVGGP